ncbi:hypothetical protein IAR55_007192 [Kwoniella newhampshirensis]|uniref:Uncharacterized protein n=1 Tax=Kwoniella newhampshirensis TaxID=1651941 RepID=A0AAW0YW28_9TREE
MCASSRRTTGDLSDSLQKVIASTEKESSRWQEAWAAFQQSIAKVIKDSDLRSRITLTAPLVNSNLKEAELLEDLDKIVQREPAVTSLLLGTTLSFESSVKQLVTCTTNTITVLLIPTLLRFLSFSLQVHKSAANIVIIPSADIIFIPPPTPSSAVPQTLSSDLWTSEDSSALAESWQTVEGWSTKGTEGDMDMGIGVLRIWRRAVFYVVFPKLVTVQIWDSEQVWDLDLMKTVFATALASSSPVLTGATIPEWTYQSMKFPGVSRDHYTSLVIIWLLHSLVARLSAHSVLTPESIAPVIPTHIKKPDIGCAIAKAYAKEILSQARYYDEIAHYIGQAEEKVP